MTKEEIRNLDNRNLIGQLISHAHTFGDFIKETQDITDEIIRRLEESAMKESTKETRYIGEGWVTPEEKMPDIDTLVDIWINGTNNNPSIRITNVRYIGEASFVKEGVYYPPETFAAWMYPLKYKE